jgi:hypothetical protein
MTMIRDYAAKITVAKGFMAGLLVKASTTNNGVQVATSEVRFLLGYEYVSAAFLKGRPKQGWIEVDVKGTPGSRIFHEVYIDQDIIGDWSMGTRVVNVIPAVVAAAPGLLSPLDLPRAHKIKLRD